MSAATAPAILDEVESLGRDRSRSVVGRYFSQSTRLLTASVIGVSPEMTSNV